jgi:hypothetical protein
MVKGMWVCFRVMGSTKTTHLHFVMRVGSQEGSHVIEQGASQIRQVIWAQQGPQRAQHGLMLGEEVLRGKAKNPLGELFHGRSAWEITIM